MEALEVKAVRGSRLEASGREAGRELESSELNSTVINRDWTNPKPNRSHFNLIIYFNTIVGCS